MTVLEFRETFWVTRSVVGQKRLRTTEMDYSKCISHIFHCMAQTH